MKIRQLGRTGLDVTVLGFGAMQIGHARIADADAGRILNQVLDMGIGLIDTARSYGLSEERIGRHIASRRAEFVLSTKVGYGVDGCDDWTPQCVRRGIDEARRRLRTEVIDIVHLHSCPAETLIHGGVLDALAEARDAGSIVAVAYSGDGLPLAESIRSGLIDSVQCSLNLCDRSNLQGEDGSALRDGIGVIAKRALAGAPWRGIEPCPDTPQAIYRERFACLASRLPQVDDWADTALRFAAFYPGVHAVLCGSTDPEHIRSNRRSVDRGPLHSDLLDALADAYAPNSAQWGSVI